VIGELATLRRLSTFNLVAAPLLYFAHEAAWNYLGINKIAEGSAPAIAKTTEAAILTSAGFFFGPFVYYGHERAWEYFSGDAPTKPAALLPATP